MPLLNRYALLPGRAGIDAARHWLSGLAQREGWSARLEFGLTLCLEEALCNVASHAFDAPSDNNLTLITVSFRPTGIVIELRDNGRPFDPTCVQPATLPGDLNAAQPGGHGLRLIRHFLSDLRYRRQEGWNYLTMTTSFDGNPGSGPSSPEAPAGLT